MWSETTSHKPRGRESVGWETEESSRPASTRGFSLMELMIVVAVISVLAAFAVPGLTQSSQAANEAAALSYIRVWSTAQQLYFNKHQVYADTVDKLVAEGFLSVDRGAWLGYEYDTVSVGAAWWSGSAKPQVPGVTGQRYFFIGADQVIRWSVGSPAHQGSPPLNQVDPESVLNAPDDPE